ncbi:MAG: hypothetical protein ABSE73_20570 [Planctomycetota bacterium]
MSDRQPDHHDAEIVLKLYDLRREAVMRESRNAMAAKFWPMNYEDFLAVTKNDHPLNAAFRQVSTYWEMAYGFARHGIVNADFLIENTTEGLFLYAKVQPFLERYRKEAGPLAFRNAEWISTQCDEGRQRFDMILQRVQRILETK